MTLLAPHDRPLEGPGPRGWFAADLARFGHRPALVVEAEAAAGGLHTVTYAELAQQADGVAAALGPHRRLVVVEAAPTVAAVAAYLGALRGGHVVLLAPTGNRGALDALAGAYDPDVVLEASTRWRVDERRAGTRHTLHPDLALVLSTSGSTGSPKLVRLSVANVQSNAAAIAGYLGLQADDRAVTSLPLHYCYGLSVLHSHLQVGASVLLTDRSVATGCFTELVGRAGVTGLAGVPHTFDLLERSGQVDRLPPTLRTVTQAGGRMAPAAVRRWAEMGGERGFRFFVMYGQTEATARMAYLPPELATAAPAAIGRPIPGGELRIDSPDGAGVGELVYRGPNVMLGYATDPSDLARGPELDELRTGDLARRTSDGLFEIVGRASRFVKPFGVRVDLDRLEQVLADRGVAAVCAGDDEHIVVGVIGESGARRAEGDEHAPAAEAHAVAEAAARAAGIPSAMVTAATLAEVPRLPNGKVDHAAVLAAGAAASSAAPAAAAGPEAPSCVHRAFAAVLGVVPADDDTFSSLGGDSLTYVELSIRLEDSCGAALPGDWPSRRVGELAALAADRQAATRRRTARVETSVALRALGIVLIVGGHTDVWEIPGAAHVLLAVAGWNFARFQLGGVLHRARQLLPSIARVVVPSMVWIGGAAVLTDQWEWPHALLVNAFVGDRSARWGYWYVEALAHILVALAIVLAVPAVRRVERRRPFGVAAAALGVGLAVRFDVLPLEGQHHAIMRAHEVFWLFALGWCAARAGTRAERLLVSVVAVAAVPGFFGNGWRDLLVAAGILAVVWLPSVVVPRLLTRPIGVVAGASLYIYLSHWQVLAHIEHLRWPATVVSIVVGIAVAAVARRAMAGAERAASSLVQRPEPLR